MCRNVAVGCLGLLLFLLIGGFAAYLVASRIAVEVAPPLDEAAVSVAGSCPREETLAWVARWEERNDRIFEPLSGGEEPGGGSFRPGAAAFESADLAAVRRGLDALATEPVPDCVEGIRAAELEMGAMVLRAVERIQGTSPWRVVLHGGVGLGLVQGTKPRLDRIKGGYAALGERLGVDLDPIQFGEDADDDAKGDEQGADDPGVDGQDDGDQGVDDRDEARDG